MDCIEDKLIDQQHAASKGKEKARSKRAIPLVLSSEVRKTYKLLLEEEDNDFNGFDLSSDAPFDGSHNAAIVAKLVRQVKGNNKTFDTCDIRAAIRTYYRTKSQEKSLRDRGLLAKRNKDRRHRERIVRKLHNRMAVFKKLSLPAKDKAKWERVLKSNMMSSEDIR